MKLVDNNAFRTVDDKLAAAKHDRDIAQENLRFQRVFSFAIQSELNAKRATVRQFEQTAFVRFVTRRTKLVIYVFQRNFPIVILNREEFSKNGLQTNVFAFFLGNPIL